MGYKKKVINIHLKKVFHHVDKKGFLICLKNPLEKGPLLRKYFYFVLVKKLKFL